MKFLALAFAYVAGAAYAIVAGNFLAACGFVCALNSSERDDSAGDGAQ